MSNIIWQSVIREDDAPDEMHPDQFVEMVQKLNDSFIAICKSYGVHPLGISPR